jgi:hypothetical protein
MKHSWLIVTGVCALAACTRTTSVNLTNHTGVELTNVVVAGSGFDQSVGTIEAGATASTRVRPSGESGLKLSFRSGARTVALPTQGYFEGGGNYIVNIVVKPDFSATVDAKLRY